VRNFKPTSTIYNGWKRTPQILLFAPILFKFIGFVTLNFEIMQLSASANFHEKHETNKHIKVTQVSLLQTQAVKAENNQ
jgi:hypothetical protein